MTLLRTAKGLGQNCTTLTEQSNELKVSRCNQTWVNKIHK